MKLPNKAIAQSLIIFASGVTSASISAVVTNSMGGQMAPAYGIVMGGFIAVIFALIGGTAYEAYNEEVK